MKTNTKRTEKECRHSAIKGSGIHKGEWTIWCKACGRDIAARYWKRASSKGKWLGLLLCMAAVCYGDEPAKHQERKLVVSNVLYVVRYDLTSTTQYSVPLTNPLGQNHYPCKTSVWIGGTNKVSTTESSWTEKGCFEDSPMLVIGAALNWKRYPNNSAGDGYHWRVSGAAMWAESDKEYP